LEPNLLGRGRVLEGKALETFGDLKPLREFGFGRRFNLGRRPFFLNLRKRKFGARFFGAPISKGLGGGKALEKIIGQGGENQPQF